MLNVKKTKMSPRKPTKILSEIEKAVLIEDYRNTTISQREVANKYNVSKTQVQKIIDQNNVVKLVRSAKKKKPTNVDGSDSDGNNMPETVKEFSSMVDLARFAVDKSDNNVSKELFSKSRRKCMVYSK